MKTKTYIAVVALALLQACTTPKTTETSARWVIIPASETSTAEHRIKPRDGKVRVTQDGEKVFFIDDATGQYVSIAQPWRVVK
jgi:ABC-type enterochelin transport system substrate-binding protein